jgi:hypothetical protein
MCKAARAARLVISWRSCGVNRRSESPNTNVSAPDHPGGRRQRRDRLVADVEVLEQTQVLWILGGAPNHLRREILDQLDLPGPDDGCRSARTLDISRVAPDEHRHQFSGAARASGTGESPIVGC